MGFGGFGGIGTVAWDGSVKKYYMRFCIFFFLSFRKKKDVRLVC